MNLLDKMIKDVKNVSNLNQMITAIKHIDEIFLQNLFVKISLNEVAEPIDESEIAKEAEREYKEANNLGLTDSQYESWDAYFAKPINDLAQQKSPSITKAQRSESRQVAMETFGDQSTEQVYNSSTPVPQGQPDEYGIRTVTTPMNPNNQQISQQTTSNSPSQSQENPNQSQDKSR